jgi:hypothetical protein
MPRYFKHQNSIVVLMRPSVSQCSIEKGPLTLQARGELAMAFCKPRKRRGFDGGASRLGKFIKVIVAAFRRAKLDSIMKRISKRSKWRDKQLRALRRRSR